MQHLTVYNVRACEECVLIHYLQVPHTPTTVLSNPEGQGVKTPPVGAGFKACGCVVCEASVKKPNLLSPHSYGGTRPLLSDLFPFT